MHLKYIDSKRFLKRSDIIKQIIFQPYQGDRGPNIMSMRPKAKLFPMLNRQVRTSFNIITTKMSKSLSKRDTIMDETTNRPWNLPILIRKDGDNFKVATLQDHITKPQLVGSRKSQLGSKAFNNKS